METNTFIYLNHKWKPFRIYKLIFFNDHTYADMVQLIVVGSANFLLEPIALN